MLELNSEFSISQLLKIADMSRSTYYYWVTKLDTNLYELRSKVGSNIQRGIYFHVDKERYVITHGFTKKSEKTPKGEITHAKELTKEWFDYEN